MTAVIEIQGLSKSFRGKPAVDKLSLSVPEGSKCFPSFEDFGAES